jgi:hypothetical protein
MEQVPVRRRQFDAAETAALQAAARLGEIRDHALDVPDRQHVRHRPAQIIRQRRCTHRVGIAAALMPAASGILDLREQPAILALHALRPAREAGFALRRIPDPHLVRRR